MKFAWVENGVVRDVCHGNPSELYTADIAALYSVEVPDGTLNGASLVDGVWTNPAPIPPVAVELKPPLVSPIEFLLLFTSAERVAIRAAVATDSVISDWWGIINDPRLTQVDLSLASVQGALDYLTSVGLIAANRKAEILTGAVI